MWQCLQQENTATQRHACGTARLAQNRVTHVARVHLRQGSSRRPPWKRSDLVGCWGPKGGAQGQQERRREHVAAPLVCRPSSKRVWKFRYRSTSIGAAGVVKRTLPLHTTPRPDLSSLRVCVAVALSGVLVSFVLLPEPLSSLLYATGPHHTLAHDKRSRGSAHPKVPKCPSESEFSHRPSKVRKMAMLFLLLAVLSAARAQGIRRARHFLPFNVMPKRPCLRSLERAGECIASMDLVLHAWCSSHAVTSQ